MVRRIRFTGLLSLFGLLVACASTTPAPLYNAPMNAEWVKYLDAPKHVAYYDPATIHSYVGGFRDVWELIDLKARGQWGILSALALVEYDCYNSRHPVAKFAGYSEHMAQGRLIHTYERGERHLWWEWESDGGATAADEHLVEQIAEHIRVICE